MSDRFATLRAPRPILLFLVMLLTTFVIQWATWQRAYVFDDGQWIHAAAEMAEGRLIPHDDFVYGYPGTTVIGLTAAFLKVHLWSDLALKLAIAIIYSLAAAGAVLVAYLYRPKSVWWPLLAWALLLQHNVYFATPPSSLLGPMLALFAFLLLYALDRKKHSLLMLALIGAMGGVAAATRLDIGGIIVGTGILTFGLMTKSLRVFLLTALIALAAFVILNPFTWHDAYGYLIATIEKISAHASPEHNNGRGAFHAMFIASLSGSIAYFLTLVLAVTRLPVSVPRGYLYWIAGSSTLVLGSLFISAHHPVWIFYPALVTLELFFPLLVLPLLEPIARKLQMNPALLSAFLLGVYLTYYLVRYQLFSH